MLWGVLQNSCCETYCKTQRKTAVRESFFSGFLYYGLQVFNFTEENIPLHMISSAFNYMNNTWNCLQEDIHANNHIGHDNSEFLLTHTVKVECQTTLIVNTLALRVNIFCKPAKSRNKMGPFVRAAWLLPSVIRCPLPVWKID